MNVPKVDSYISEAEAPTHNTCKHSYFWQWSVICLLMLAALPAQATTYYVAAAGSDANSGTDAGHPWQTIAKINASTFSAGDSILFNKGDVWYGTALIAPSSGSSGSPITSVSYTHLDAADDLLCVDLGGR